MSALMITTEAPYPCPSCGADLQLELEMKHGVTRKQAEEAADFETLKTYSVRMLERCMSCDYTVEARE